MRKKVTKILSLTMLVFGVIFLSGCGTESNAPVQKDSTGQKKDDASEKVVDTKNSNLNNNSAVSADNEESLLSQEESDANEALSGSEDLNDLANTYDENKL